MTTITASFNNKQQMALTQYNEAFWKSEPIQITFDQAVHATDEITAEQYETERQIIEEENERILRHGDQGAFENG